jgi:hypothetical protein
MPMTAHMMVMRGERHYRRPTSAEQTYQQPYLLEDGCFVALGQGFVAPAFGLFTLCASIANRPFPVMS